MTFAPATTHFCIAHRNLSATIDHYGTHDNLGPTTITTLEACSDLSTTTDLQTLRYFPKSCGNHGDLCSTMIYPF